jgi:stage II sporulation protein D
VRTYALCTLEQRRRTRPAAAFLFDGVEDQAYGGEWAPADSAAARRVAARLRAAIEASRGQVLTLDGQLLDARFHAACGGATATLEDVFPRTTSRSPGRPCAPCAERALAEARAGAPDARRPLGWSWTASSKDLARAALHAGVGGRLLALEPLRVDESGRWREVQLRGPLGVRRMPFEDLRALLGRGALKSGRIARTWPRAGAPIENGLRFDGYGRGHGVGLCQEGARDHAERGWDARRILAHYYPTAHVTRLPAR